MIQMLTQRNFGSEHLKTLSQGNWGVMLQHFSQAKGLLKKEMKAVTTVVNQLSRVLGKVMLLHVLKNGDDR